MDQMDRSEDFNLDVPEQEPIGIFEGPIGAGGVPVPEEVLEKSFNAKLGQDIHELT
jgi:hypothetical protein